MWNTIENVLNLAEQENLVLFIFFLCVLSCLTTVFLLIGKRIREILQIKYKVM